ncbi:hypothetical protein [Pseudidiomarina salilacus]|uniref:hypothetical protein n=1 Tax=Pseudidiomarina salilacus TaxID=3384452 RepID=UPI003984685F
MKGLIKTGLKFTTIAALSVASFTAVADLHRSNWTTVQTLLVHDTEFGGCMARLAVSMKDVSGGICGDWVAFSCTGELNDVTTAQRLYESVQIAYLTQKEVKIQVDDNRQHNGHCVATRIDFQ